MVASLKNMAVHVCLLGHVKKNDVPRFFLKNIAIYYIQMLPVVPRKAVAEVSKIGNL